MDIFTKYLQEIEDHKKAKEYDRAWDLSQKAMMDLVSRGDEDYFAFYYQLADIAAREQDWETALLNMALVTHHIGRLGGVGHEKLIRKILKNLEKTDLFDEFVEASVNCNKDNIRDTIMDLIS